MKTGLTPLSAARWGICVLRAGRDCLSGRLYAIGILALVVFIILTPFAAETAVAQEFGGRAAADVSDESNAPPADRKAADKPKRTIGDIYADKKPRESKVKPTRAATGLDFGRFMRAFGWTLVVVLGAIGFILILKKLQIGKSGQRRAPQQMEILSRTQLTPKHQLIMVRVQERALVLGISPDGIHTVTEFSDPADVMQATSKSDFSEILEQIESDDGSESAESPNSEDLAHYQKEIERIKSMVGSWRHGSTRTESAR